MQQSESHKQCCKLFSSDSHFLLAVPRGMLHLAQLNGFQIQVSTILTVTLLPRSWSLPDSLMFLLNSLQGLINVCLHSKPSESAHPPRPCVPEVIHNPGPLFSCLPASITPFILAQLLPCLQILPPLWVSSLVVLALTHPPLTHTTRLLLKCQLLDTANMVPYMGPCCPLAIMYWSSPRCQ